MVRYLRSGFRRLGDESGGDLQCLDHEAGPLFIDTRLTEGVTYVDDGGLQVCAILDGQEFHPGMGVLGAVEGVVQLVVVVAVRHTAERGAVAAPAIRHDVMTIFAHRSLPSRGYPPPLFWLNRSFAVVSDVVICKPLIMLGLAFRS